MRIDVYADVLFALNYLMDLIIVFITAMLARLEIKLLRLSLSAAVLALYGTMIFYPQISFIFSIVGRLAVSFLAVSILSCSIDVKKLIKINGIFRLVAAVIGGVITALCMLSDMGRTLKAVLVNGSMYLDIGFGTLVIGVTLSYVLILVFKRMCVRGFGRDRILIPINIYINQKRFRVTALIDTGCELTVPLTGEGVILVPRQRLGDIENIEDMLIPMRTADGIGYIHAFYPDRVECSDKLYRIDGKPAVGIVEDEFTDDGLYTAILNPDIIKEIDGRRENEKNKAFYH